MLNCVIIDDEPLAIEVLEGYLKQIDNVALLETFHNPVQAMDFLCNNAVDLFFWDIEMPSLTGIELIKNLNSKPKFIFTTAYPQYALDGFDLDALDYLVKPIPFPRFLKAVQKAQKLHHLQEEMASEEAFIFVRSDYEDVKINTSEICYIEGLKDYLKIYLDVTAKPILTLMGFSQMLEKLPKSFIRAHRSYIVNIRKVQGQHKERLLLAEKNIPIGNTYKASVFEALGLHS